MSCLAWLTLISPLPAADWPAPESWRVWLEPKFWHAPVVQPIPGAERVELAAGSLSAEGLQTATAADFAALPQTWPAFYARAVANADAELQALTVRYERNRQKVILYAELTSRGEGAATAVLAPRFTERFENTLGPNFLVVVPHRGQAFLFPKLASNYQAFAPLVLEAFRSATHPVSLEVFETTSAGLRAVGRFANPGQD